MNNIIPEYDAINEAINDLALRTQQLLIAIDLYEFHLNKINDNMPSALMTGYNTKETIMSWGRQRTPQEIIEQLRKSKQFVYLNAFNQLIYLIDDMMKMISIKYYNYNHIGGDEGWFSPDIFSMLSNIKLDSLLQHEVVSDLRSQCDKLRKWKITNSYTSLEFYDLINKVIAYCVDICVKVYEGKLKGVGIDAGQNQQALPPSIDPKKVWPPPKKEPEIDDYEDLREEFGEE